MINFFLPFAIFIIPVFSKQYFHEDGLEFFRYASAVFCDDGTLLNWACDYPCKNTTGMTNISVKFIFSKLTDHLQ